MDKGLHHPFSKKGDLGIAKNYREVILTSAAAMFFNALQLNSIEPEIEKILRKNKNGFRRNWSTTLQILIIRRTGSCQKKKQTNKKNIEARLLFVHFSKAFDSIHRVKMEQIILIYSLPKETVATIMILYSNTNVKVHSTVGDTDFFDIVVNKGTH